MMERGGLLVCRECMLLLRNQTRAARGQFATPLLQQWSKRGLAISRTAPSAERQRRQVSNRNSTRSDQISQFASAASRPSTLRESSPQDLNGLQHRILELANSALRPTDQVVPSEQRVLYVLEQMDAIAKALESKAASTTTTRSRSKPESTATSALLGSVNARQHSAFMSKTGLLDLISENAESILRHRNVFITPAILRSYIDLQAMLQRPNSFPDIFELYASKPAPRLDGSTIEYTTAKSNKINTAIDAQTANLALNCAIQKHNLPLCIDIITSSFATAAFKKSKLLRQALLPGSALAAAPVVAYGLSAQFGLLQTSIDPTYATSVAFAGILTYVGTVCSLGYIVITTANDQMDRVTWAKGVPLWERWLREEERAALDRVAGNWGFQSLERRGEEEGEEWESLRECVGLRGMVLDRVELMEGME